MADEVPDKRVGTGGVVGRVGEREDVRVFAEGKALDGAKLRVL